MQLQAGRGGLGSDRVGGELHRLTAVDDAHQKRPVASSAHAATQQRVARVARDPLDGQLLGTKGGQHADGDQPSAEPLDPRPARVEHIGELAFAVLQHAALQPAGSQVQLDVELAELVLHVRSAQACQDRVIDQPRPAQRVHEIELDLHTDGVLMADKPAAVDHALQCGNAALEPALHLVVVPDNQGGRVDAVTHGAPPRGTAAQRPPPPLQHGPPEPASQITTASVSRIELVTRLASPISPAVGGVVVVHRRGLTTSDSTTGCLRLQLTQRFSGQREGRAEHAGESWRSVAGLCARAHDECLHLGLPS